MTANLTTARDDMLGLFATTWAPTTWPVHYPGIHDDSFPPPTQTPWARVQLLPADGNQATLSDQGGVRRYRHVGLLTAQVFTPLGDGGKLAYTLAQTVMAGFQGVTTTNGVLFRNVRPNVIGPSADWFQINVLVNYEYDELV